jgi:hypothetical protein
MNSIYLRSISGNLKSFTLQEKPQPCEICKKYTTTYKCGYFRFCCCSHANDFHMKYDIGAASTTISFLLLFKELCKVNDVIYVIGQILYQVRKRNRPIFQCMQCNDIGEHQLFYYNYALCNKFCVSNFFYEKGYKTKDIKKLRLNNKSCDELTMSYKW